MIHHAVMGDMESLVDLALAVHALAALGFAHQFCKTVIEHAGANSRQDIFAAVLLQHHGFDALQMQQLRQQQTRRPAADDANLDFHRTSSLFWMNLPLFYPRGMDRASNFLYKSNMQKIPPGRSVQTYNLFGEAGDLPDVVHCETIAARSVLHEWEFAPHRHARLHQILLIERGSGQATLEGHSHALLPMRVVNVPVGDVHGFTFKPGTQGWVLTVAAEMLDEVLTPSEGLRRVLAHSAVVRGTPQMRMAMQQIFAEFAGRNFARAHVLRALSSALIGLVARELAAGGRAPGGPAKSGLFQRFEALLDQHFVQHW